MPPTITPSALAALLALGVPSIGCASPPGVAAAEQSEAEVKPHTLDELKWKARPIVLIAPSPDDPRIAEARATIAAARADHARRDMALVVVTAADHPLRARFDVPKAAFAAILVGKDGGEKARVERLDDLEPWFALIDSMPMRQGEMRARGESSPE